MRYDCTVSNQSFHNQFVIQKNLPEALSDVTVLLNSWNLYKNSHHAVCYTKSSTWNAIGCLITLCEWHLQNSEKYLAQQLSGQKFYYTISKYECLEKS